MSYLIIGYKKIKIALAYSFDFMFAGNLIILSKFFSYSANSAKVCFREDVDFVSEPTV